MYRRSRGREVALQLLFQLDHNSRVDRAAVENFVRDRLRSEDLRAFCRTLYDGVLAHRKEIDDRLTTAAENWRVARMAAVDRNVLRLGAYEVLFAREDPPAAVIEEAIELARRYGSADSPAFVNGILDRLLKEDRPAPPPEEDVVEPQSEPAPETPPEAPPAEPT